MSVSDGIAALDVIIAAASLLATLALGWVTYRYARRGFRHEFTPPLRPRPRVETKVSFLQRPESRLEVDITNDGAGPVAPLTMESVIAAGSRRWFHIRAPRRVRLTHASVPRIEPGRTATLITPMDPDNLEAMLLRDLRGTIIERGLDPSDYGVPEYIRRQWYEVAATTWRLTVRLRYQQAGERHTRHDTFELRPLQGGGPERELQGWVVD